jgi:hypothetical protein
MHSVDAILSQLANKKNLDAVRWAVVALVREQLFLRRDSLDDWEAAHFANAISMLAMNVNALQQPTAAWLRLCLVDLRHALTPQDERPSATPDRNISGEYITLQQLTEALDAVVRQLDRRDPKLTTTPAKTLRRYLDRISHAGGMDFGAPTFSQ